MIGYGAYLDNDQRSLFYLLVGLFSFSTGWLLGRILIGPIHDGSKFKYPPKKLDFIKFRHIIYFSGLFLVIFFYIAIFHGIPMLLDDASAARIGQREYSKLVFLIEYCLVLFTCLPILASDRVKKYAILYCLIFGVVISTALAVRYLFMQAAFCFLVLSFINSRKNFRSFFLLIVSILIMALFFGIVQYLRSGGVLSEAELIE